MNIPDNIARILSRLEAAGYEAYIVGGCVRDSLMEKAPHDFDITTSALPEETISVFEDMQVIPTGIKHGTVTVLADGEPVEITTYRVDGDYADGRHPDSVSFTRSLEEDLSRRDFTMNGIAYSPSKGIVDIFGGENDIKRGIVRCIGDPDKRFGEDALRILRALRFSAVLGFDIHPDTAASIESNKASLSLVSAERIFSELQKLICGKNAADVLLKYHSVICQIIPELLPCYNYEQHSRFHSLTLYEHLVKAMVSTPPDEGLRLAMLLHDIGKPLTQSEDDNGEWHFYGHAEKSAQLAEQVLDRLKSSNALKVRVIEIIRYHDMVAENRAKFIRRRLSKHGPEMFRDIMLAHIADDSAKAEFAKDRIPLWKDIIRSAEEIYAQRPCLSTNQLAINGRDLSHLITPSPKMGEVMKYLLGEVLDGNIPNEREVLLKQAESYLSQ